MMVRVPLRSVLIALALSLGVGLANDIGLAPARLELTVAPGATVTETVTVATTAALPQQVSVGTGDWTLDVGGSVVYFPLGTLPTSAAAWLVPEAEALLLEPNATRDFRLTVRIPDDPTLAGTYQAMLFFQVDTPNETGEGVGVQATTRIALTVYITIAGTERGGAELVDLFVDGDDVVFAVANLGNTVMRLGGFVELRDEEGATLERIAVPNVPVLRESEREVALPLPEGTDPGFYVALALIEDSRGGLLAGELPFTLD
jgi:hypothetical protein